MIDIPVEVKEALREGSYKKKYEFEVYREETIRDIVDVGEFDSSHMSFSVVRDAQYILYSTEDNHAFDSVEVMGPGGSRMDICPVGETETWFNIGNCYNGDTITIYGLNATSVGITTTDNVAYVKEWAYDFTLDNNNLVKESVSIDERMCSGDILKFGLCEGSSLEFQYFGKRNIKGDRIKASVKVNHLQYAEGDVYIEVGNTLTDGNSYRVREDGTYYRVIVPANSPLVSISFLRYRGNTYTDVPTSAQDTIIESPQMLRNDVIVASTQVPSTHYIALSVEKKTTGRVPTGLTTWTTIPMGYFTVEKCSRQASTGIIKVTAYNKLMSDYLDAKANSLIEDIIAQGEDGLSSASIYYVLKELLQVYSVNVYNEEESAAHPYYGTLSFNGNFIYADDGEGNPNGYYNVFYITRYYTNDSFSSSEYYRFEANTHKIKELIHTIFDGKYWHSADGTKPLIEGFDNSFNIGFTYIDDLVVTPLETFNYLDDDVSENIRSNVHTNVHRGVMMRIPVLITHTSSPNSNVTDAIMNQMRSVLEGWDLECGDFVTLYKIELSPLEQMRWSSFNNMADVTLRELQSAVYETVCQYGQLDRETDLFSGVELGSNVSEAFTPSQYETLWADEGNIRKWRYLIITYKGLDEGGNEAEFTLQRTINADGTNDYNMSDNWLFRNLVWTAEQVGAYADAMVAKMQDITWFPFEMWAAGLPYLETGDKVEMTVGEEDYTSYILQRQLKGIQNLQDTYINGTLDIY